MICKEVANLDIYIYRYIYIYVYDAGAGQQAGHDLAPVMMMVDLA